jgi:type VI secretion system protein ImpK
MRSETANLVHAVLQHGLRLRERLEHGERPTLEAEQAALKSLLLADSDAARSLEFSGEGDTSSQGRNQDQADGQTDEAGRTFLGIRYALVCWLDELFVLDSAWQAPWNECKLEMTLYGTNDRAWRFWEQARLAESRPGIDVLEAYYLCVMLGFRGELRQDGDRLEAWCEQVRGRLDDTLARPWPAPDGQDPPTRVPPLRGAERLRKLVLATVLLMLATIPAAAWLVLCRQLGP